MTFQDTEYIVEGQQNGASGYLLKDSSPEAIPDGLKSLCLEKSWWYGISEAPLTNTTVEKSASFDARNAVRHHVKWSSFNKWRVGTKNAQTLFRTVKNNTNDFTDSVLRDRTQLVIFDAYETNSNNN